MRPYPGLLAGKARLLVTHSLHSLPVCDRIYVMVDGRIVESGSYAELMAARKTLSRLVEEFGNKTTDELAIASSLSLTTSRVASPAPAGDVPAPPPAAEASTVATKTVAAPIPAAPKLAAGASSASNATVVAGSQLIAKETSERGNVAWNVYTSYFKTMNAMMLALLMLAFLFGQVSQIASSMWLAHWAQQDSNAAVGLYLGVYAALGLLQSLFTVGNSLMTLLSGLTYGCNLDGWIVQRAFGADADAL